MASAKADADVALEANVVAGREFKCVESGDESSCFWMLCPGSEYSGISGASVFVRDQMSVIVVSHSVTATGKASVNTFSQKKNEQ